MALNERLAALREQVRDGSLRAVRTEPTPEVAGQADLDGASWLERATRVTEAMCAAEKPVIWPAEQIVFTRTVARVANPWSNDSWADFCAALSGWPGSIINNICADWGTVLSDGLLARRAQALETRARLATRRNAVASLDAVEFLDAAVRCLDAVLDLVARYAREARQLGRDDLAERLERVPAFPPRTLLEALQSLRLLHASLWLSAHGHVGLGRLDQYLWPYLQADLEAGRLSWDEADELLAEFFISLNRDTDLYPGVQRGDNGQSLMLGGVTADGAEAVNPLTQACLRVSAEVGLIDPKINLRVTPETDLALLREASKLTRLGLGFPQYANDEVVIPALVAHGYRPADARNYTVAACWEFIIPGHGMEIVNVGAVSLPAAADLAIREGLAAGDSFEGILARCRAEIARLTHGLIEHHRAMVLPPAPWYSVLMEGPLASGRDLSQGLRYNSFGLHGAGSAAAADALAAVKQLVFDEQAIAPADLLAALAADFDGYSALRQRLLSVTKVGNHDPQSDGLLHAVYEMFADACEAEGDNGRGGHVRPGTGTAMFYVWLTRGRGSQREPVVGSTADGRRAGELFGANLAPTPGARVRGPFSVLQSFAKVPYERIYNGGPITLELADNAFRGEEALDKAALLVRGFAQAGCQQLQINTLDLARLEEAQRHPERHRDLVVRVWGWSGYFCELEPVYQEHVMARHRYGL